MLWVDQPVRFRQEHRAGRKALRVVGDFKGRMDRGFDVASKKRKIGIIVLILRFRRSILAVQRPAYQRIHRNDCLGLWQAVEGKALLRHIPQAHQIAAR